MGCKGNKKKKVRSYYSVERNRHAHEELGMTLGQFQLCLKWSLVQPQVSIFQRDLIKIKLARRKSIDVV